MRVKSKSETVKHGEGESHAKAKARVKGILEKYIRECGLYNPYKSKVYEEYTLIVSAKIEYYEKNGHRMGRIFPYQHPYDLWLELHVLKTKLVRVIALEIDGKSHEKQKQQRNDRRAEYVLMSCKEIFREFPDVEICRIGIENAKHDPDEKLIKLII